MTEPSAHDEAIAEALRTILRAGDIQSDVATTELRVQLAAKGLEITEIGAREKALREAAEVAPTAPAPEGEIDVAALLPCDVLIAPATIIRAGCKIETVLMSIERRRGHEIAPLDASTLRSRPGAEPPTPSGFNEGVEAAAEVARDRAAQHRSSACTEPGGYWASAQSRHRVAVVDLEGIVDSILTLRRADPRPDAVAKTAGLVDDDDLLRSVGLLFFDAMSVRCEPRSYARRCIQLVQERIAALHAPAPTAPEPPVWRHDFNAYVPVQRSARGEADEVAAKVRDALWQLLDDMGESGVSVCIAAKKQAIEAYNATRKEDDDVFQPHVDLDAARGKS